MPKLGGMLSRATGTTATVMSASVSWCALQELAVVHPVEVVAGQDQHVVAVAASRKRISCWRTASAVPWYQSRLSWRLLGREDLDEAAA